MHLVARSLKPDIFLRTIILSALLLFSACSHLFYQPEGSQLDDPKKYRLNYEERIIESDASTRLMAWYFPRKNLSVPSKGLVIQFHGNAENISSFFASLVWVIQHGYDFLTFDYRGYGASEGSPSQKGLNTDAIRVIEYGAKILQEKNIPNMILYGQSLGGAVLARALGDVSTETKSKISHVVLDSSFTSYTRIAREKLSEHILTWPLQWLSYLLISNQYGPEDYYEKIAPIPLLIIHGEKDPVIPSHHGTIIFKKALPPKELWIIPDGRHIDALSLRYEGLYQKKLLTWWQEPHTATTKK